MALQIWFYIFAIITVVSALMVVTSRNPVRAVLSLVLTFVGAACLWMLLQSEFLALILIVVYVGAVMVLFMFVVMMLDIDVATHKASFVRYWPLAILIGALVLALLIWVVGPQHFGLSHVANPKPLPAHYSSTKALGVTLFTDYLYPFILAAVLLLAAMIAAIVLTHRPLQGKSRRQKPSEQIRVNPKKRMHIVDWSKKGKGK